MAMLKAQFLRCASPGKGSTYKTYASPFPGLRALNLNFLLCHLKFFTMNNTVSEKNLNDLK